MSTIKSTKTLTSQQLRVFGARESSLHEFEARFGTGALAVTVELGIAAAEIFGPRWAADHLLSAAALASYEQACRPALVAFEARHDPMWTEYRLTRAAVFAGTAAASAQDAARAAYEAVREAALTEYNHACARVFGACYTSEG